MPVQTGEREGTPLLHEKLFVTSGYPGSPDGLTCMARHEGQRLVCWLNRVDSLPCEVTGTTCSSWLDCSAPISTARLIGQGASVPVPLEGEVQAYPVNGIRFGDKHLDWISITKHIEPS